MSRLLDGLGQPRTVVLRSLRRRVRGSEVFLAWLLMLWLAPRAAMVALLDEVRDRTARAVGR